MGKSRKNQEGKKRKLKIVSSCLHSPSLSLSLFLGCRISLPKLRYNQSRLDPISHLPNPTNQFSPTHSSFSKTWSLARSSRYNCSLFNRSINSSVFLIWGPLNLPFLSLYSELKFIVATGLELLCFVGWFLMMACCTHVSFFSWYRICFGPVPWCFPDVHLFGFDLRSVCW